ncbi:MAG: TetR/AcrR family transcriptional regulator [Paraprevotella sp.]|nr:TetR/AcrR family transcriptional regulator [Paraprevotella sp.]
MKQPVARDTSREEVMRYAEEAFMKQGIRSVKMDDIAEHLGMSKRTLYEMFENKEALLLDVMCRHRQEFYRKLEACAAGTDNILEIVLQSFLMQYKDLRQTNPRCFEDIKCYPKVEEHLKEVHDSEAEKAIAYMEKGVGQGMFRSDVNLRIFHSMLEEVMRFVFRVERGNRFPLLELYSSCFLVILRGICTLRGLQVLDKFLAENDADFNN